ncbi:hypothetical protein TNCT_390041, partial [Trichonephila clavata]
EIGKCPPNAQFSSCGSPVFPTCDNPYPIVDYDDQCLPGCFCNPGFLMSRVEPAYLKDNVWKGSGGSL